MISILLLGTLALGQGVIDTADVNEHSTLLVKRVENGQKQQIQVPDWAKVRTATLRAHGDHVDLDILFVSPPATIPHEGLELEVLFADEHETRRVTGGCLFQLVGKHADSRLANHLTDSKMATWDDVSRLKFADFSLFGSRLEVHLPKSMRQIVLYSVKSSWKPNDKLWRPVPSIVGSGSSWLRSTGALSRAVVSFRQLAQEDIAKIR
jgi:hypothetical protein